MTALSRAVALILLAAPAIADVTYVDFSSTAGLTLAGSASQVGNRLQVTPNAPNQSGAFWATARQDVSSAFTAEFTLRMSGAGEGMAFVIQREAADALGSAGEGLGYSGITGGIAIEFDTAGSLIPQDPSGNHVAMHSGGAGAVTPNLNSSLASTSAVIDLDDNTVHSVRIEYVPGLLQVFVDDTITTVQLPVDIESLLSLTDGTAWVGFTAGTSNLTQVHEVLSWSFDEQSSVPTGNVAPLAPVITEPVSTSIPYNPFDVHMEAGPFVDPDGGRHVCSDFEIWTMNPSELVWRTDCISGPAKVHSHLGDGVYLGSHAGRTALLPLKSFRFRVRFRDDSGDPLTEWGTWSERTFQTGAESTFYPFETEDIVANPAPIWKFAASSTEPILPTAMPAHRIVLESQDRQELLAIEGNDGVTNTVVNPDELPEHVDIMVRIESGGNALSLPETDLIVVDDECKRTRVLIPAISLPPNSFVRYWISTDGATWVSSPGQTTPDFSTLVRGLALPWVAAQPGYQVEVVATGFRLPVNVEFIPNPGQNPSDPFAYVSELYGAIKVVANDGTVGTYASNLLNYNPMGGFPGSGEQGLGGIAIDPITGDVFAGMLYNQNGPHYPKVVRFSSSDGGLTAATETIILDMAGESQGQSHFISHLEMLADGTLLVHMGDGFDASTARDPNSFRGKILRLNLDGTPVNDNPFFNGAPFTALDYIYVLGVRNPFGGRVRASDGFHYMVENGPSVDRFARIVPGRDYLWAGSDSHMLNFALHNWAPATGPVNLAFIQMETFAGSGFPQSKWDHAFVSESGSTFASGPQNRGKRITEFELDAQGNKISGPTTLVEYAGTGRASVAGLSAGPDGLYFTDLYRDSGSNATATGANLLRIRWVGAELGECGSVGQNYCGPAVLNSSGLPATIRARGSDLVADNDLQLDVEQLPPNAFGYCLGSLTQGFAANPGGSAGNLCLGGTIGRFVQQAQNSGSSGTFSVTLDLANMPAPLSTVAIGETWNFQAWFRDFQIFVTSNFTDGVSVMFR
ncbi:MAG: glucose/arabinose dehydrogenase [Paracoccaceae bacterium]|jgi:glucose/arabinose dehydrogenase